MSSTWSMPWMPATFGWFSDASRLRLRARSDARRSSSSAKWLGQHLDRHLALEARVPGAVDLAHSPGAEGTEDLVVREGLTGGEGHGGGECSRVPGVFGRSGVAPDQRAPRAAGPSRTTSSSAPHGLVEQAQDHGRTVPRDRELAREAARDVLRQPPLDEGLGLSDHGAAVLEVDVDHEEVVSVPEREPSRVGRPARVAPPASRDPDRMAVPGERRDVHVVPAGEVGVVGNEPSVGGDAHRRLAAGADDDRLGRPARGVHPVDLRYAVGGVHLDHELIRSGDQPAAEDVDHSAVKSGHTPRAPDGSASNTS